ncbi:uncharacterized protein BP01DRAFT_109380 [Aspergillus saccharolyticus JOP 1030-1]|uniref:Uncharacterized protein n=1 Tax=Aspergillus saccharolyticus JOP 1030-1 TaxID=1450539 RepID=A0A318Z9Y3_9EURO|nr:hypothetical protein BP01DRAFT_109380 [Aspergillus saccharolyticus JOP 1030-1]PYH43154.1 hypothetical protein BP01DRAFT_109380 [Aspergillus saccharolyticus JOP 1030-1]
MSRRWVKRTCSLAVVVSQKLPSARYAYALTVRTGPVLASYATVYCSCASFGVKDFFLSLSKACHKSVASCDIQHIQT